MNQKHNKMAYQISSRVSVPIKSLVFIEYIPFSLNRIFVA